MARALGRAVAGVYDGLVMYGGLLLLGAMCVLWTPFAMLLYPLLPARAGRAVGRFVVMAGFRFFLASLTLSRRCQFDLDALDALRAAPPLIIAPIHPCMLDAVLVLSRLPNVGCVLKAELMNNFFLGAGARLARFIRNEPVRRMVQQAMQDVLGGSHLLLFPEGTRTTMLPVNRLKGSVALIACHAQVPVQTVLIETDSRYLSKGWPLFRRPPMPMHYRVRLGKRFEPSQDTHALMAELEHYFAHELVQGSAFYPAHSLPVQTDRAPHLTSSSLS
jgi:1-acyl-sn-glycerol-3-phosphate acyltransferase